MEKVPFTWHLVDDTTIQFHFYEKNEVIIKNIDFSSGSLEQVCKLINALRDIAKKLEQINA